MFRFGGFELDLASYELRRDGLPIHLERRPMDLLILLVERRDELVSRAEIVRRLWGADVFVDVDMGVNTAIRKVRRALGDSPEATTFITTIAGKGYRFTAPVVDSASAPTGVEPSPPVTIAILPFDNISGDPSRDYLADGLTEEAIAVLGAVDAERILVIGRTSVLAYRSSTKSLADIGRELGAAYLVESSLRSEGGRLRITSRLIRASDQAQIWSSSFDSEPRSLLEFQRELCTALAHQIQVNLSPVRISAISRRQTRDAEAYHLYLQGRYFFNQLTPETMRQAVGCFVRATERDPDYALAWSGIADAHASSPISGDTPPLVVGPLARAAAQRALAAEPDLAAANTSMGTVGFFIDWNWPQSVGHLRRALAIDPGYPYGHRMLAIQLSHMEQHEEAVAEIRRARELDPLYAMHHALSAQIAFAARDPETAAQFARQAVVIDPAFWIGHWQLAQALEQMADADGAFAALDHANRLSGNSKAISMRGYLLARRGRAEDARDVLRTLVAIAQEGYVPPYAMALVYLGLGEYDEVFGWLERARALRDVHLIFLPVDPKWDVVRSDPRFARILADCAFSSDTGQTAARV